MNDILKEELIYEGPVCRFTHDTVTFEDGTTGFRDVLHLPGAVAIIAENSDGNLLFVSQYRHAVETQLLELPAGMLEKNEDPVLAAARELQEETGYKAGKIEKLVDFFTSPGVVQEKIYIYMASDLTFVGQHLDEDEYLNVKTYAPEEIEHMIANNELKDGKSIIAFELWKNRKSL